MGDGYAVYVYGARIKSLTHQLRHDIGLSLAFGEFLGIPSRGYGDGSPASRARP